MSHTEHGGSEHGPVLSTFSLLLALGILWGITFPMVRMGVAFGTSPFLLVALDFGLAAGLMLGIALATGRQSETWPSVRYLGGSALLGALLIGGNNLLLFWGVRFTTGGVAAVVYATVPLLAVVAGLALGGRSHISGMALLALSLGLIGVLVLEFTVPGGGLLTNDWTIPALIGGAGAQAVGTVLVVRYRPTGETRLGLATQFGGASIVGASALLLFPGALRLSPTPALLGSILFVSLVSGAAGYTVFFELTRRSGAVSTSLVMYLTPIVGLLFGAFVLSETVGPTEIAGLAIILAALALYEFSLRGHRTPADPKLPPSVPESPSSGPVGRRPV